MCLDGFWHRKQRQNGRYQRATSSTTLSTHAAPVSGHSAAPLKVGRHLQLSWLQRRGATAKASSNATAQRNRNDTHSQNTCPDCALHLTARDSLHNCHVSAARCSADAANDAQRALAAEQMEISESTLYHTPDSDAADRHWQPPAQLLQRVQRSLSDALVQLEHVVSWHGDHLSGTGAK